MINYSNTASEITVSVNDGSSFDLRGILNEVHGYSDADLAATLHQGLDAVEKGVSPAKLLIFGLVAAEVVGRTKLSGIQDEANEKAEIEALVDELTRSDPDLGKAARALTDKVYAFTDGLSA